MIDHTQLHGVQPKRKEVSFGSAIIRIKLSHQLGCYDPGCEHRYNWLERKEVLNSQTRIEMEDQTDLHRAKPKRKEVSTREV